MFRSKVALGRLHKFRTSVSLANKSSVAAFQKSELQQNLQELENGGTFEVPFARAKIGPFFQEQPKLGNQYLEDVTLQNYLKRFIPKEHLTPISQDLERFGDRVGSELYHLSLECERDKPIMVHYDAFGKRVDEIITSYAWKKMKVVAAEEGMVSIAYEREQGEWSRLYQVAKQYLFTQSSGLFSCPLAMTDGAARIIEVMGDKNLTDRAFPRLTSRDPQKFWTSGQWMTERRGGSDVANGTETLAVKQSDGTYRLYGYKWFTSATDSDMTLTLARVVDENGQTIKGTKGLSMFYAEVRDAEGNLNNIAIQRLKDKLGTRQLPTAELLLDGMKAIKVSEEGRGVASISDMLTMTRIHNSTSAAAAMKRMINLARDFSHKRQCFGKLIRDQPLHIKTLASMEIEQRASLILVLDLARRMGMEECGVASDHDKDVFRLMTPVTKLYTAKQAMAVTSEGLECFGGLGYLEDTGLPMIMRDAQVLPIWEGTTNILSLDVIRAMAKSGGTVLQAFHKDVHQRLSVADSNPNLQVQAKALKAAADKIVQFASQNPGKLELAGRDFAFSLARTYMGMLLVEHACWQGASAMDALAAQRWCQQDLVPVEGGLLGDRYSDAAYDTEYQLVMDGYKPTTSSKL